MDAAENIFAVANIPFDECYVVFARKIVDKAVNLKFAELSRHGSGSFADDMLVVTAAVIL